MSTVFYASPHTLRNKIARYVWGLAYILFFRFSPDRAFAFRRVVLRFFGAKVGSNVIVYPDVKIWAPWNLIMKDDSCLSRGVDCYSQGKIEVGRSAVVSQRSFLCGASHDHRKIGLPLIVKDIRIGDNAWICAEAFIGPGVVVGSCAVVGARAVVTRNVDPMVIVAGNPARKIADRKLEG